MQTIPTKIGNVEVNFDNLNGADAAYHTLMLDILMHGKWKENRTGTRTISLFGPQVRFDNVGEFFPLISSKKVHLKSIIGELLWFLSGNTNKFVLKEKYGVSIWDEWGDDETGEMGPIYGNQWVNWEFNNEEGEKRSINQLQEIINRLKHDPDDRRMIVSAWHVEQIPGMALPPCHWSYQFYSVLNEEGKRELSMNMNIRSWDVFLGGPFNIASYAILLQMVAQAVDMIPKDLIINAGDAHLYEDHIDKVVEQLKRDSPCDPVMTLNPDKKDIFSYLPEDFTLSGYDNPHPNWKNVPIAKSTYEQI